MWIILGAGEVALTLAANEEGKIKNGRCTEKSTSLIKLFYLIVNEARPELATKKRTKD